MIKALLLEDDIELGFMLSSYLKQFNIEVETFEDPFLALSTLNLKTFDIVILDLTLPGMDGLEVCKEIMKKHKIPVIISSARSDITDKVTALELGADDYLPKPYDPRELEVRIKTILRRYNHTTPNPTIQEQYKIFILDEKKREITKNGVALKLTVAEFEVLSLFLQRDGFVISREDIFDNCDAFSNDEGSLVVIINRIRNKIEENPKKPEFLETIRGMGYKFVQNK
ncbi:MAG: response regulator transcription factor [Arcobacteraceae bacterium]|nr:response regulator transcription factor [Arcobacteraceae bacterium]